ncbi:hypothetical protein C8Q76DRAFT_198500 [Earliella scabrosa]|nr:hypothetical protein C8Q76DRAFT_198500 [Earliella scabrosa]
MRRAASIIRQLIRSSSAKRDADPNVDHPADLPPPPDVTGHGPPVNEPFPTVLGDGFGQSPPKPDPAPGGTRAVNLSSHEPPDPHTYPCFISGPVAPGSATRPTPASPQPQDRVSSPVTLVHHTHFHAHVAAPPMSYTPLYGMWIPQSAPLPAPVQAYPIPACPVTFAPAASPCYPWAGYTPDGELYGSLLGARRACGSYDDAGDGVTLPLYPSIGYLYYPQHVCAYLGY